MPLFRLVPLLVFIFVFPLAADAASTNPPPRLVVDLRDGSRVVGTSVDNNLKFRSILLGQLKLAVKDIRTVECVSSNSVKLTTQKGDTLAVSFVDSTVRVKASFGRVDLPTDSIRKLSVEVPGDFIALHPGLVALWSGDGNVKDSAGKHDGELLGDCEFGSGQFGQAFQFDKPDAAVKIAAANDLDVGKGSGFTLESWINPTDVTQAHPIFEWNNSTYWGVHFHIAPGQPFNDSPGPGELYANIPDTRGMWHQLSSAGGVATTNQFQLVALTYDRATGVATIYYNGNVVGRREIGKFIPLTSYDLYLGRRPAPDGETASFAGLLEDAAVYNRALTADELREDYESGQH